MMKIELRVLMLCLFCEWRRWRRGQ